MISVKTDLRKWLVLVVVVMGSISIAAVEAIASPVDWLGCEGKSDAWCSATEHCRQLLEKLQVDDQMVKTYLPSIRQYAEMLGRVDSFDWKTITAVEFLENMLEDLATGKKPNVRYAGRGMAFPYWSETMLRIEAIWIHVPPDYDPAKSYQVLMYYKCGGGIHNKNGKAAGGYRPTTDVANQTDSFHCWSSLNIQIKGRMGGYIELSEAMDALCREFSADRDRVFLTGWSDGGFTAVWLASHYPHLVTGIAPNCGNWQYANVEYLGLTNLPTLNVDGWFDGGYNIISFARWQMLYGDGADSSCIWGQHGHSYQPYEDVEEFKLIHDWAKHYRRDPFPKRVRYATWNLAWHQAYWVSIERMIDPLFACQIDIEVKPDNRIEGRTWNVAELKLSLCDKLVDMSRPVEVIINGRKVYSGPAESKLDIEMAERPKSAFVKDATMPDEITAVMVGSSYNSDGFLAIPDRRWISVRPTNLDATSEELLAKWWPEGAKPDVDVTDQDLADCNLILYGGPEMNKLTARMAEQLPVKFGDGKFSVGSVVYDKPTNCVALLHPNPLNPKKYVLVYACNNPAAFAAGGFFEMEGESIWKFRRGDCVISGIPAEPTEWGVAVSGTDYRKRHVMFGADWQPDQRPPLGEATAEFDYLQLLRLRADALREVADVDVGIIWSHSVGWNRWENGMSAGSITLHDIATSDACAEQVCVGEMTGENLLNQWSRPAAWSLLADRREPGYIDGKTLAVPDIAPEKIYRVAMNYHGIPLYRTNPKEMPRLFTWTSPAEFLTNENNSMPIKNLRRTPLQVAEAVARYVSKHKKIAPRPTHFGLTDYIINPKYNDYGACNWLHLGADIAWPEKSAGGPRRYTISLGARRSDAPESAEPRPNAKGFVELDLAHEKLASFDFADLEMKLPVSVTTETQRWAIVAGRSGKSCVLEKPGAAETVGCATLLLMKLESRADKDIALQFILNRDVMSRVYSEVWPDDSCKEKDPYFAGYHRAVGRYRQPPVYEEGVLLLSANEPPSLKKLITEKAGYNLGLVGLEHQRTIPAGKTRIIPLLIVWVDKPDKVANRRLVDVLIDIKSDLLNQLPGEGD